MAQRTVEIGGETLGPGSVVIVFDGNSQKERVVASVGTRRIQLECGGKNPVPYSLDDRKNRDGAYVSWFKTKTEVAQIVRRNHLVSRLRDLGAEARVLGAKTGFDPYPNEVLQAVADLLQGHLDSANIQ